jgi:hypothetical protein
MTTTAVVWKYALTKVGAGDYLLPSNDAQNIWRIHRYTDGPSNGLDLPRDRELWGVWRWTGRVGPGTYVDTGSWDRWELRSDTYDTRRDAITAALVDG